MKTGILQLSFAIVCGIGVGFVLQRYLANRPNNSITKVISSAGEIIGITQEKPPALSQGPAITEQEKLDLFHTARGYVGGANPPRHVLDAARAAAAIAQARIDELGLRAEYEQFVRKLSKLPKTL